MKVKPKYPAASAALTVAALLGTLTAGHSAIVYRETFGNGGGSNASANSVGWSIYSGPDAENRSARTGSTAISAGAGPITDEPNVGQSQISASESNGLMFMGMSRTTFHFAFTTEYIGASPLTTSTSPR